jgi:hypothetical protein
MDIVKVGQGLKGRDYALVVVDLFTKWPEVYLLKDQTAMTVAHKFVKYMCRHQPPAHVLSDRGKQFTSKLMKEICNIWGVHQMYTTSFHPNCNGISEIFNRWILDALAKSVDRRPRDWDKYIDMVLYAYRSTPHSATGKAPYEMLYGEIPKLVSESVFSTYTQNRELPKLGQTYSEAVAKVVADTRRDAEASIGGRQASNKRYYDKRKCRDPTFVVGDRVWYFYRGLKKSGDDRKLMRSFIGPYKIVELTDKGVARIHRVDHPGKILDSINVQDLRKVDLSIPVTVVWDGKREINFDPDKIKFVRFDARSGVNPKPASQQQNERSENNSNTQSLDDAQPKRGGRAEVGPKVRSGRDMVAPRKQSSSFERTAPARTSPRWRNSQ